MKQSLACITAVVLVVAALHSPCHAFSNDMSSPRQRNSAAQRIITKVQQEFQKVADLKKAVKMQAYVKSDMPMYGVQKPERAKIEKRIDFEIDSLETYRNCVNSLWNLPHREEKYLAIDVAMHHKQYIGGTGTMDLYEEMLRQDFMWWDLCDPIAIHLVGSVALKQQHGMEMLLRQWIQDENLWIRRAALLAQLKHMQHTNADLLFEFCHSRMHEKEFFIRKAIGWVLREYSRTDAEAVKLFLKENKASLSGLSYREASKYIS